MFPPDRFHCARWFKMKGIPPHQLVSLHPGAKGISHVGCPQCGHDLYGSVTNSFFKLGSSTTTTSIEVACPKCGTHSLYSGELEGVQKVDPILNIPLTSTRRAR